jgi:HK97 family phage portal protein
MGLFTKAVATLARRVGLVDSRLYQFFGAGETDAGEIMSVNGAMQIDVVWACVRRIAETVATLPLHVYELDAKGNAKRADDHPLYPILHDRPNSDMTSVEFFEALVGCYLLWGNSFAAITRGTGGRVIALYPMRPDRVSILPQNDGSLLYRYVYLGTTQTYTEDEILHIKGFSLDGLMGLSPVGQARQNLGTARAAERASSSFFKNGMRPSGYLKAPDYLTAEQREQAKELLMKFKGAAATGGTPLLEGGWEWTTLAIPPEEAQMLQTRTFHVEQICRWFDVPPVLVGHSGQTTWGSGIEQIMLGWLTLGLRSHLKRIEQAINRRLITAQDRPRLYAEFNVDALLRADSAARATQMATLAQNGLRTRNELRALDNLPPITGGDELTVQSNLLPIEKLGERSQSTPVQPSRPRPPARTSQESRDDRQFLRSIGAEARRRWPRGGLHGLRRRLRQ